MPGPQIDVLIVNWNGGSSIMRCLAAVHGQLGVEVAVICVDNASSDGSTESIERDYPQTRVLRLASNVGFAAAVNQGFRAATSPWLMLLNFDVVPSPDYCRQLVAALQDDPRAGWGQGLLLRGTPDAPKGTIDSAGHEMLRNRWVWNRAEEMPTANATWSSEEVWGATAAAAVYRRAMLDDLAVDGELLDGGYFAYLEDVDLDWRAHWQGWRCLFVPYAVAYHQRSGTGAWGTTGIQRRILANRYRTLIRNDDLPGYLRHFGDIGLFEIAKFFQLLVSHPGALLGYVDVIASLPETLRARKRLKACRRLRPQELSHWFRPVPYRRWLHRHGGLLGRRRSWISRP